MKLLDLSCNYFQSIFWILRPISFWKNHKVLMVSHGQDYLYGMLLHYDLHAVALHLKKTERGNAEEKKSTG